MNKVKKGYIQLYTGNGKGKTTAALGITLRAASSGFRVCFIQFCKGGHDAPPVQQIKNVDYFCFGKNHEIDGWYKPLKPGEAPPAEITAGWTQTKEIIAQNCHDLIILDELNIALYFGFISLEQVIKTLESRPEQQEIVITGRSAPQALIEAADIVTNMEEVRHIYQKGIPARKGLDF